MIIRNDSVYFFSFQSVNFDYSSDSYDLKERETSTNIEVISVSICLTATMAINTVDFVNFQLDSSAMNISPLIIVKSRIFIRKNITALFYWSNGVESWSLKFKCALWLGMKKNHLEFFFSWFCGVLLMEIGQTSKTKLDREKKKTMEL